MNNLLIYNKLMLNDRCMQLETGHRFNQPAFAVVSIYSNANWGAQVYNHNLQKATATHRYNSAHKTYNASELANTYYGGSTTNSTTSSGANRGNGTSMVGHLGHNCLQIAADGTFSFAINTNDTQTNVGTWVHNTTPHLTINMSNGDLWISKRSYAMTDRSVFGKPQSALGLNDVKRAGTLCYNERTRKLAILESDGSYKHRLNVWDKIKSPALFRSNEDFWGQLTEDNHTQTEWCSANPSSATTEDNYRGIVVLCDNDDVVVTKMIPSKDTYSVRYTYTDDGYTVPTSVIWKNTYTTSYGFEQGNQYGIRFQISNNGQYVIAYSPTYYYGSGYNLCITDTKTGKVLYQYANDSTYGYNFVPVNDTDFMVSKSINADGGVGMTMFTLPTYDIFNTLNDGDEIDPHDSITKSIDTGYYSTSYDMVLPIINSNLQKFINRTGKLG